MQGTVVAAAWYCWRAAVMPVSLTTARLNNVQNMCHALLARTFKTVAEIMCLTTAGLNALLFGLTEQQ
jgi:hypothetical protein